MKNRDPLSDLLRNWQPQSPHRPEWLAQDTMRQIRHLPAKSFWREILTELLEQWLPAPRIWVPFSASVIMLFAIIQGNHAVEKAKALAAVKWQEQISQPLATRSLTGAYISSTQE